MAAHLLRHGLEHLLGDGGAIEQALALVHDVQNLGRLLQHVGGPRSVLVQLSNRVVRQQVHLAVHAEGIPHNILGVGRGLRVRHQSGERRHDLGCQGGLQGHREPQPGDGVVANAGALGQLRCGTLRRGLHLELPLRDLPGGQPVDLEDSVRVRDVIQLDGREGVHENPAGHQVRVVGHPLPPLRGVL